MRCEDVDYSNICNYIPDVIQTLYDDLILKTISLEEFRDAFRIHQMQSKTWLLNHLDSISRDSRILVIGGWLGFTSYCLHKNGFKYIHECDPDKRLKAVSCRLNMQNDKFLHMSIDVNQIDMSQYDLIINTSSEHISDNSWFQNIKHGTIVALQSTNLKADDHTNLVHSTSELKEKYPLNFSYADEMVYNETYSRYMIIGEK